MRAIVQEGYGSSGVFRLTDIDRPEIEPDEVLIEVRAAGIDRGTWHLMAGTPYALRLAFGLRRPSNPVPGLDVAGTVAAVGADVTRFAVGDEVLGIAKGSFAEFAAAKVSKLVPKPAGLGFEAAAVVAVSGLTAIQGLRDVGRLVSGQRVLVLGASGGVGSYALQLAKADGAEVTAVCGATKVDLVRSLGADHVIDYSMIDPLDGGQRYDLILDAGGDSGLRRLRRCLRPKGTLVIVGGERGKWIGIGRHLRAAAWSPLLSQRLKFFVSKERFEDLEALCSLIESGQVTPALDRTYPLEDAAAAIDHLASGRVRGKLALALAM